MWPKVKFGVVRFHLMKRSDSTEGRSPENSTPKVSAALQKQGLS
jgi:hypothetical protein